MKKKFEMVIFDTCEDCQNLKFVDSPVNAYHYCKETGMKVCFEFQCFPNIPEWCPLEVVE